jgi:hypothetical protein
VPVTAVPVTVTTSPISRGSWWMSLACLITERRPSPLPPASPSKRAIR